MNTKIENFETEERLIVSPAINTYESEKEFLVEAEMPGTEKSAISVTLEGEELIISAVKRFGHAGFQLIHEESLPVEYRRTLRLGGDTDASSIQASYDAGVLSLRFKKNEKVIAKKVTVQ